MPRRLKKLLSTARVLGASGFVGALYGGFAGCAAISAAYFYMAGRRFSAGEFAGFISEYLQCSIFGYLCGVPGGLLMGIMAALIGGRFGWFYGGAAAGASYGVVLPLWFRGSRSLLESSEFLLLFLAMSLCGLFVARAVAYEGSTLPLARWLRRLLETSPLENCAAWKRTVSGVALPFVVYAFFLIYLTWPIYWQNRAYVSRLGFAVTWQQSYYFATNFNTGRGSSCQSNLKQLMLGVLQYQQDYDERLPLIASGGKYFGWADSIFPYVKSTQIFQCPSEFIPSSNNPRALDYSDYWFNTNLSGASESAMNQTWLTISLGEGNDGVDINDARYNRSTLPPSWLKNSSSPAQRHVKFAGGAYYAFLDGHVKWLLPPVVSSQPSQTLPSLAPQ